MILADVSVLIRLHLPAVADAFAPLAEAGTIATCGTTELQLLTSLADPSRAAEVIALRAASFAWLPTTDADLRTALATQETLLGLGESVAWPSLVVAAVAQRHTVTVLHYDPEYDLIAKVTGQTTTWVLPYESAG
jgi:predicted nucleic acid-binding protein